VTTPERCGIVHDRYVYVATCGKMGVGNRRPINTMDDEQAKNLGKVLRQKREALGLSLRQLGKLIDLPDVTVLRFEQGAFASPAPDKLAKVASALGMSLADVYALADYAVPADLPSFTPYLRTKYRDLPSEDIEAIERYAAKLAKKHGVSLSGPAPGEDES
jgi:transcriptional regulator with XRE-family HTH domain